MGALLKSSKEHIDTICGSEAMSSDTNTEVRGKTE